MRSRLSFILAAGMLSALAFLGYRQLIPVYRVPVASDLVMLANLNGIYHIPSMDPGRFARRK